jgi:maltose alpha-D-glucosyltransferase/alpha-amylase
VLYDAGGDPAFAEALLAGIAQRRRWRGDGGSVSGVPAHAFRALRGGVDANLTPSVSRVEQSNTSIIYGDRLILKLFRKMQDGPNPDLELGRYLAEEARFTQTAPLAGSLEYQRQRGGPTATLGILQGLVPNEGDAWSYTLDELGRFFERALACPDLTEPIALDTGALLEAAALEPPELARDTIDIYLNEARLLGQRTAELHLALAANREDPAFAPEALSTLFQRSVYQSMRSQAAQIFTLLRKQLKRLPEAAQDDAQRTLSAESRVNARLRAVIAGKLDATRTRIHGDYHLGQVLFTGGDFVIIDFEGEPARGVNERRMKRSPLRDVAGMLRSFHYAASTALADEVAAGMAQDIGQGAARLEQWVCFWRLWVSASFLGAYLETAGQASFVPRDREQLRVMLDTLLLNKAVYELGYELNNRPDWVRIPLIGILELVGEG